MASVINVKNKISFGTAGYRGFLPAAVIQALLSQYSKDGVLAAVSILQKEKRISADEARDIENYLHKILGAEGVPADSAAEDVNDHVVALLGYTMGRLAMQHNDKDAHKVQQILLSYDTRANGRHYAEILARAIRFVSKGRIEVIIFDGHVSTPTLSYLMQKQYPDAWALHVTSSHNPFWYTGFKPEYFGGAPAPEAFTKAMETTYSAMHTEFLATQGNYVLASLSDAGIVRMTADQVLPGYLHDMMACIQSVGELLPAGKSAMSLLADKLKHGKIIHVDAGMGEAVPVWQALNGLVGRNVFVLSGDDIAHRGTFQFKKPEPTLANLKAVGEKLPVGGILLANDPDADRTTVLLMTAEGLVEVSMNEIAVLILDEQIRYIIKHKNPHKLTQLILGTSLASSKLASQLLEVKRKELSGLGITVITIHDQLPVGFKWFSCTPTGENLLTPMPGKWGLVFEESGGMSLAGWTAEKDGPLGALLAYLLHEPEQGLGLLEKSECVKRDYDIAQKYGKAAVSLDSALVPRIKDYAKAVAAQEPLKKKLADFVERKFQGQGVTGYKVNRVHAIDGLQLLLEAHDEAMAYFTFRPSGTEPKARVYLELIAHGYAKQKKVEQDWEKMMRAAEAIFADLQAHLKSLPQGAVWETLDFTKPFAAVTG